MSVKVQAPYPQFNDIDGRPLDAGYIYIGEAGKNPEVYPVKIFLNPELTVPAQQPLRTRNGFIVNAGSLARIYISQDSCSLTVKNKNKVTVSTALYADSYVNQQSIDKVLQQSLENIDIETTRAKQAEYNLQAGINTEKTERSAADNVLQSNLDNEKARAIASETALSTAISAVSGGSKSYKTLAAANADKANITANSSVYVTNDGSNSGVYNYDGTNLTKSDYDPLTQSKAATNRAGNSITTDMLQTSKVVEDRYANFSRTDYINIFNAFIYPTILKNSVVNYLSASMWYQADFDKVRLRIIDLTNLNFTDGMQLSAFLSGKTVLQDITLSAADVTHGSPRIKYNSINNGVPVEMRIPFQPIASYADQDLRLGFLVEAFYNDGSQARIHGVPTNVVDTVITSIVGSTYYTESSNNQLRRLAATESISFQIGYTKDTYKSDIRKTTERNSKINVLSAAPVSREFTYGEHGYLGIGKCFKSLKGVKFNNISFFLNGLAQLDYLRYVIYSMTDNTSTLNDSWIAYKNGEAVYSDKVNVSNISNNDEYYKVDFPFDEKLISTDKIAGIMIQGIKNNNVVTIGFQCSAITNANLIRMELGCYAGINSNGSLAFNIFSGGSENLMYRSEANYYTTELSAQKNSTAGSIETEMFGQSSYIDNFKVNGLSVDFNVIYANAANKLDIAKTLTFDATATKNETRTITLLKSEDGSWSNNNTYLARYMHDVVVKQGAITLVKDVDYKEFDWYGKLNAIKDSLNNVSVSVSYSYEPSRLDIVVLDTYMRTIEIKKGTERTYDPYDYAPAFSSRYKPLAYVLVRGNTLEFMPIGDVYEVAGKPLRPSGDYLSVMENNRKALAATFAKLSRGENIKLIGYGDSITADEYVGTFGEWTRPNGKERDRADYLEHYYPSDSKALTDIKKFTRVDYDGTFEHAEIGWNWSLKNYIEDKFDVTVDYQNWAIGGGNITDGKNRMSYVLPTVNAGDIAVICYGTNGGLNFDDLDAIITGFKSKNVSVIMMPAPIANPANAHSMSDQGYWSSVNGYMIQAAMRHQVAVVPTWHYLLEHSPMSIGLSSKFRSNQNLINHPGLYEFQCYGKMLVNAFSA